MNETEKKRKKASQEKTLEFLATVESANFEQILKHQMSTLSDKNKDKFSDNTKLRLICKLTELNDTGRITIERIDGVKRYRIKK